MKAPSKTHFLKMLACPTARNASSLRGTWKLHIFIFGGWIGWASQTVADWTKFLREVHVDRSVKMVRTVIGDVDWFNGCSVTATTPDRRLFHGSGRGQVKGYHVTTYVRENRCRDHHRLRLLESVSLLGWVRQSTPESQPLHQFCWPSHEGQYIKYWASVAGS